MSGKLKVYEYLNKDVLRIIYEYAMRCDNFWCSRLIPQPCAYFSLKIYMDDYYKNPEAVSSKTLTFCSRACQIIT